MQSEGVDAERRRSRRSSTSTEVDICKIKDSRCSEMSHRCLRRHLSVDIAPYPPTDLEAESEFNFIVKMIIGTAVRKHSSFTIIVNGLSVSRTRPLGTKKHVVSHPQV